MKVHLLIIDPQMDFCSPHGSLYVKGADGDMDRLSQMVERNKNKLDDIHVTLDSHRLFDIAHPAYWVNSNGKNPNPFTIINPEDIENGTWAPAVPSLFKRSLEYVRALKKSGRYALCIWPVHCRIGTEGHNIYPNLMSALTEWEKAPGMVDMVTKGSNPYTEHYSAVLAEVPDPEDPSTQLNTDLIKTLKDADMVAIAGEASSHCVANTVRDIANNFGDDSYIQKLVFLKDASSAVTGFENLEKSFLDEMIKRGMKISSTKEFLA
jgi:nicotinamidase-related amidase